MHYDAMPLCLKFMLPPGAVSLEQVLQTRQNKGIPMTTKLRSCFPPCRFSSSAFTSICCLSLPDFLTGVGVELSSSDAWMEGGRSADLWALVSRTLGEAPLPSSPGGPLWGVCRLSPFSSEVKLQKDQKETSGNLFNCCSTVSEHRDASFCNSLHFGCQLSDSSLLRWKWREARANPHKCRPGILGETSTNIRCQVALSGCSQQHLCIL